MNIGLGLGVLALIQVVIAWLSDHSLAPIDNPLFTNEVGNYEALGIKDFFAGRTLGKPHAGPAGTEIEVTTNPETGKTRTKEVLRFAGLASAARQTVTSLLVSLVSLVGTLILIATAHQYPYLKDARIAATGIMAGLAFLALFILLIKISAHDLSADLVTAGEMKKGGSGRKWVGARYWARLRSAKVLTRYRTAAFIGALTAIVTAIGLK